MIDAARRVLSSYRIRIAVGYLIAVAVLAAGWVWTLYAPISSAVLEQQGAHLRSVAQAGAVALPLTTGTVQGFAEGLVADSELRATVIAEDGTVLADTEENPASMENHSDRPEIAAALEGTIGVNRRDSRTLGTEHIYVAVPTTHVGSRVVLRVSESASRVTAIAAAWRRNGLLLLGGSLIVAVAVSAVLAERASASVTRLVASARSMAEGNLRSAVPLEPGDLGVLSRALNDLGGQMRARLEDLEAEQRTLHTVLDGLTDAVFLTSADEVLLVNRAVASMFRTPYGGWKGASLSQSGLPACVVRAARHGASSSQAHSEDCPPDPLGRSLRVTAIPLDRVEGQAGTLLVVEDITERVRLDGMRRDFVANASHELKTPTTGIQLLAESAAAAALDGDTAQAMLFVSQIEGESTRLRRLVLDLLDLARLETAQDASGVTDARQAIDLALLSHRRSAAEKGLSLTFDDSGIRDMDAYVACDRTDLAIALDNLLANAIAYTDSGGVNLRTVTTDAEVSISVEDTGIGIPPEILARVFERFYRVDRARSRDSGGTGLGLSLVKHVAERVGGAVDVTSEVGVGSTFTLRLPRATAR